MGTNDNEDGIDVPWPKSIEIPRRFAEGLDDGEIWAYACTDEDEVGAIWNLKTSEKVRQWNDDSAIRAVAASRDGKRIAVGFDDGAVQIFTDKLKTYFLAPIMEGLVRDLKFHPRDPRWLAIASESGMQMLNTDSEESVTGASFLLAEVQQEHEGSGIRSVIFGVTSDNTVLLSTLSMDGRHCLWDVSGKPESWSLFHRETSFCVTKKDVGECLGSDPWDRSCRGAFAQLSSWLIAILPGEPFPQIRKIDGREVSECNSTVQEHSESIVLIAVQGEQVVTSGRDGKVLLWRLEVAENGLPSMSFLTKLFELQSPPTDLIWQNRTVFVATIDGSVHIKKISAEDTRSTFVATNSSVSDSCHPSTSSAQRIWKGGSDMKESDDEVDFTPKQNNNPFLDDEAAEDEDSVALPTTAVRMQQDSVASTTNADLDANENYDDNGDGFSTNDVDEFQVSGDDHDFRAMTAGYTMPSLLKPQAPFSPSSTPLDLPHRILCWNNIGTATWHRGVDGMRDSIEIHFTDSAFSRPIRFTDTVGFLLGSLGEDGGIFCSDIANTEDDDDNGNQELADVVLGFRMDATKAALKKSKKGAGSTIFYHRFNTIGANRDKDWYVTLPDGERALGCATGQGWAAVITSRRFLRLFTSGGNQGKVVWLEGEPVSIAGRGRFVGVFYHRSLPFPDGTQKIGYVCYDVISGALFADGAVTCVSTGSSLSWVGYSNDLSLLAYDSSGMLSALACPAENSKSWEWIPVLDTVGLRKSSDDSHWPITAIDGKLVCVPLKGGTKHPDATRRPVTTIIGYRLPLGRGDLTNSVLQLEELSIRAKIALDQKKIVNTICCEKSEDDFESQYMAVSAQVDKVVLKHFSSLVENGKPDRALDLIGRLHLEKSYKLAMVIADNHDKLVEEIEYAYENKYGHTEEDYGETPSLEHHITTTDDSERHSRITPDSRGKRECDLNCREADRQVRSKIHA